MAGLDKRPCLQLRSWLSNKMGVDAGGSLAAKVTLVMTAVGPVRCRNHFQAI